MKSIASGRRVLYLTLPQAIRRVNYTKIWFDELRERKETRKLPTYIA